MNARWYLLIPSDNQRKQPGISYFTSEHILESLEKEYVWELMALDNLNFGRIFIVLPVSPLSQP